LLENLCEWWDHVERCRHSRVTPFNLGVDPETPPGIHWRHPFGVYNSMDEGGGTDLDEYLETGNEVGLTRTSNLFPELTDGTATAGG
jgi:hypothetical protein